VSYCSNECQKKDWAYHKLLCKNKEDPDKWLNGNSKDLKYDDFEVIKLMGEGNFTKVYKVFHKKFPDKYYALKVCDQSKVKKLRKELDILMEKHSLNKVYDHYGKIKNLKDDDLPTVKLISTFKDESNLYFLTELLQSKDEVWESCRTFGILNDMLARFTFYQICLSVKALHDL